MGNRRPKKRGDDDEHPAIWVGYGKLVKLFREQAGLTQQGLADAVAYSYDQVASIEQGRKPAKAAFTEAAEHVLEARGALKVLQDEVDRAKLPRFFRDFALLEEETLSRFDYESRIVPGLLQTEAYARGLSHAHCPPLDEDTIEQRVEARLKRQSLMSRRPSAELSFIIAESALRCPVGGIDVLREQLEQLLGVMEQRNVQIQIVPTANGSHAGLHGSMVLLETTTHQRVAYFESHGESVVICDPDKVSAFGLRYAKLRSQSLSDTDSKQFVERIVGES